MTTKELNRDIKRLYNKYLESNNNVSKLDMIIEYRRLYEADPTAKYISMKSLKIMILLNHKLHAYTPDYLYRDIVV